MDHCEFVPLPQPQNASDTRMFTAGETVCLRGFSAKFFKRTKGIYVRPAVNQNNPGNVQHHIIDVGKQGAYFNGKSILGYEDIGKYVPISQKIKVNFVAKHKNLPENIQKLMKEYGGGKRRVQKTRRVRKSTKRSTRSKQTRKH